MDRLSSVMLRAALIWLLIGVIVGGVMLSDGILPGAWRVWSAPSHAHMLFVGWFLQFAVVVFVVQLWSRSAARPLRKAENRLS